MGSLKFENIYLEVKNENKKLAQSRICLLNGISGEAYSGKLNVIMGDSGCGKTTLFNVLIGRISSNSITSGVILFNDQERSLSKWNKQVTYLEQDDVYFKGLTTEEIVFYDAELINTDASKIENRESTKEALKRARIEGKANTLVGALSGGERKRAMIAAVLATKPDVLLLDEPTTGLDSHLALGIVSMLKKYAVENDTIVIMTVHQPGSGLFSIFDNLLFLSKGVCFYSGPVSEIENFFNKHGIAMVDNLSIPEMLFELQAEHPVSSEIVKYQPIVEEIMVENRKKQEKNLVGIQRYSNDYVSAYGISLKGLWAIICRNHLIVTREYSFYLGVCLRILFFTLILSFFLFARMIVEDKRVGGSRYKLSQTKFIGMFRPHIRSYSLYEQVKGGFLDYLAYIFVFFSKGIKIDKPVVYNEVLNFKYTPTTLWIAHVLSVLLEALFYALLSVIFFIFTCIRPHLDVNFCLTFVVKVLLNTLFTISYQCLFYSSASEGSITSWLSLINFIAPYENVGWIRDLCSQYAVTSACYRLLSTFLLFFPMFFQKIRRMIIERQEFEPHKLEELYEELNYLWKVKLTEARCTTAFAASVVLLIASGFFALRKHVLPGLRLRLQ